MSEETKALVERIRAQQAEPVDMVALALERDAALARALELEEALRIVKGTRDEYVEKARSLRAEVERLKAELSAAPKLWECPDCCFGFDARHVNQDGTTTCPNCAEERLKAEVERLTRELETARDECSQKLLEMSRAMLAAAEMAKENVERLTRERDAKAAEAERIFDVLTAKEARLAELERAVGDVLPPRFMQSLRNLEAVLAQPKAESAEPKCRTCGDTKLKWNPSGTVIPCPDCAGGAKCRTCGDEGGPVRLGPEGEVLESRPCPDCGVTP